MAAVAIATVTTTPAGYNLTDSAGFSTLVAGSGNGVVCPVTSGTIVLKNDTGGAATFTILTNPNAQLTALGLTTPALTVAVADGKTYLLPISQLLVVNGYLTIECSVAGKALILV